MNNLSPGWIIYLILLVIAMVILLVYKFLNKRSPSQSAINNKAQNSIKNRFTIYFRTLFHPQAVDSHTTWKLKSLHINQKYTPDLPAQKNLLDVKTESANLKKKTYLPKQLIRWILIFAFFLFAEMGQFHFLNYPIGERQGIRFYLLAIAVFSILIWFMREKNQDKKELPESENSEQSRFNLSTIKKMLQNNPQKFTLFGLSLILSILSLILLINRPELKNHWDIFFLWISSCLCYAFVFIRKPNVGLLKWGKKHKTDILFVLFFTVLGGVFRFYNLGKIPGIIDGDEGRFGLIIVDILEGRFKDMFTTIYGNSSMYFFFLAGMMKLFGNSTTILRIGSAIGGTLTIPMLYLMANHFFNRRTAIISTAVLVVSNFHIHFSHIMSVTSIQDALFATTSLYLFLTGLQYRSSTRMTLSGLVLGLALYIYMGARLIILLIPIYLLIMLIIHPETIKRNTTNIIIFFGALSIISLPMIHWAITNPDLFNIRAYQVGIFQSGWLSEEALQTGQTQIHIFLNLFKQAFLTTIFYPSRGFHYSSWPMLDMLSSIFFMAGLIYSLIYTKDFRYLLLNGWFWSGILVGGAFVTLPSLNTYRIMIVFPAMCLFSGIGLDRLLYFMKGKSNRYKYVELTATVGFILLISLFNLKTYFVTFAPNCRYEEPNTRLASQIASYASNLDQDVMLYLLTAPQLRAHTHLSMPYLSPGRVYNEMIDPLVAPPETLTQSNDYAFFFIPTRINELQWIKERFPGGTVDQIYDCNVPIITVYIWTSQ